MNQLYNKILLILYTLLLLIFVQVDLSFVMSLLITVFLTTTIYFLDNKRYSRVSTALFTLVAFFYPPLYYFSPVLVYDMVHYQNYPTIALLAAGLFIHLFNNSFSLFCIIALGLVWGCYQACSEEKYNQLHQLFRKTRDDSTELYLLLEEKNKYLLDKQDYEIYNATLKERNRIAREIHDNVGHMLSRSILLVGAIRTLNKDTQLNTSLETLSDTLNTAMNNIRTSVHDLHDESINLQDVTTNLIDDFRFCPVDLEYDMSNVIPREIKYCFIAILKEALSNIQRHSNASHAYILLREHPGFYQMMILDNGTQQGSLYDGGIGLSNMKDRVEHLRGQLQISQDQGFRIFITIPKKALQDKSVSTPPPSHS